MKLSLLLIRNFVILEKRIKYEFERSMKRTEKNFAFSLYYKMCFCK